MKGRVLGIIFLIIFLTLILKSVQAYEIPIEQFELNNTNLTNETTTRGIVVEIPKSSGVIESSFSENDFKSISDTASSSNSKVVSLEGVYDHYYMDVPSENYTSVVNDLKSKGYGVRDEIVSYPQLNDSIPLIGAPYTWSQDGGNLTLTGAGRTIMIIDTGIDATHPDLNNSKVIGWRDSVEVVDNGNYSSVVPYDYDGHGTHVASIAAGTGNASNSLFRGVASGANLIVARACKQVYLWGQLRETCDERYIEDALRYALNLLMSGTQIDAISMSLGSPAPSINQCTNMTESVNSLTSQIEAFGTFVVAAAGNSGPAERMISGEIYNGSINWPACLNNVIAVGATYNRPYKSYDFLVDKSVEQLTISTEVHVIVSWTDTGGTPHSDNFDWQAFNATSGGFYEKSGFDKVFHAARGSVLTVYYEYAQTVIAYNALFGYRVMSKKWFPNGNDSKGIAFLSVQCSIYNADYNPDDGIAVEFTAFPNTTEWDGSPPPPVGWHYTLIDFTPHEYSPGFVRPMGINVDCFQSKTDKQLLTDMIPFFSSRGPSPQGTTKPNFVAPGVSVCAAFAKDTGTPSGCGNSYYTSMSGTSMATPMVAGSIALINEMCSRTTCYSNVYDALIRGAVKVCAGYWPYPYNISCDGEGHGKINVQRSVNYITNCSLAFRDGGYNDTDSNQCPDYFYSSLISANQIRNYYWFNDTVGCGCKVSYDSSIGVSISGTTDGDAFVSDKDYITTYVQILNTGSKPQNSWYAGVEFWNVSDYNDPSGTRDYRGRINAFYNGNDGTHGCVLNPDPLHAAPGSCPSGVDCSIIYESISPNNKLDVGEVMVLKCQAPASFYKPTTGNQRIMIWAHERDLTQDANNNGIVGEWWADALSRTFRPGIDDPIKGGPIPARAIITDTTPPQYDPSSIIEPTDPSLYSPLAIYTFKINWNDNMAVNDVVLSMDGTNYSYRSGDLIKIGDNTYGITFSTCSSNGSSGGGGGSRFYLMSVGPVIPLFMIVFIFLSFIVSIKKRYKILSIIFIALVINPFFAVISDANVSSPCLGIGTHYYKWYAKDISNNWNSTNLLSFTILKTDPVNIYITSPENVTYSTNSVDLKYSVSSPFEISWIGYSLDNKPNVTLQGNTSLIMAEGSHNIIYYANTTWGVMNSSQLIYFTVSLPKPDLIINDIQASGNTISYTIKNQGNANAGSSYSNLYVDSNYIKNDYLSSLTAGSSANRTFSYSWTCSGTSDSIKVCADANNNIFESNENNNCLTKTFTCPAPPTCTCTGWINTGDLCTGMVNGCYYKYTRTCTPSNCGQQSKCVYGGKYCAV
jgi:subtilisin family serine protease